MAKKPKPPRDLNALAAFVVREATDPTPDTRNPSAVALSKLGAAKGGRKRADTLSPDRRRQIAKAAAAKRWRSHTGK